MYLRKVGPTDVLNGLDFTAKSDVKQVLRLLAGEEIEVREPQPGTTRTVRIDRRGGIKSKTEKTAK